MNLADTVILGIIQGLTEFLPISSDGHLAAAGLIGLVREEVTPTVAVMLHSGTLAALLVWFWRDALTVITSRRDLIRPLVLATIVTAAVAIPLEKLIDKSYQSAIMIGLGFIGTALLLAAGEWSMRASRPPGVRVGWPASLVIGLLQGLAVLPGLSRSGSTMAAGFMAGLERDAAVRFAFLLGIPAIGGAVLLKAPELAATEGWGIMAAAFGVSFVTGLAALALLFRALRSRYFVLFAVYTLLAGTGLLIYGLRMP
ncbi:MAG: undecaprenyl-diphosphate phosphatase [Planctomycetota bacterium]